MSDAACVPALVEAGDRYPTSEPCGAACRFLTAITTAAADGAAAPSFLAVEPYSFVFQAPAKGRWIDRPLLSVCVQEFAYVPPPTPREEKDTKNHSGVGEVGGAASLDSRITLPAYVEELCDGLLWLHGRESECRAAGAAVKAALTRRYLDDNKDDSKDGGGGDDEGTAWRRVKQWLRALPADSPRLRAVLDALPRALLMRQRDVLHHRVWRQEGRLFAGAPLRLLRCDMAQRRANANATGAFRPALLALCKPSGLPVHPSGRYRKNACTSILEDIFGGCDAGRYSIREPAGHGCGGSGGEQEAAVVHRKYGFVILTVRLRGDGAAGDGLSAEDWQLLKQTMRGADGDGDGGGARGEVPPLKAFVVHRLDAATSGVLLFGLDSPTARATALLIGQKEEAAGASADAGVCRKTYLALVHGRLDVQDLLLTAPDGVPHNCSAGANAEAAGEAEGAAGGPWLRVDRPIGCLNFHRSLYWCPGAARTRRWRREAAETAAQTPAGPQTTGAEAPGETVAIGRLRKDAATVAAKNERMRQLTKGGAKRQRAEALKADWGGAAPSAPVLAEAHEAVYMASLKGAATLLRTMRYDAARDATVVECRLLTGRTHQLRVHLASLGHPIVGDAKYEAFAAAAAESAGDVVSEFYTGQLAAAAVAEAAEGAEGLCACPERIGLHAWSYTLQYPPSGPSAGAHFKIVAPPEEALMQTGKGEEKRHF